ncbi:MAG TPA: hypothetical protein P5514_15400 [Bacteroidales bacterium]|nr:hypothetical protein [Bacteroidales bacterium]HRX98330.1 hypothetical protein [Bacteroidales bacterium]
MNKIQSLIIFIFIFFTLTAESQIFQRYGLSGGLIMTSQDNLWDGEDASPYDFSKMGLNILVHMEGDINQRFAYSSDIGYTQKGYIPDEKWKRNYKLTLHYISYNPQIKIKFGNEQAVTSIFTGLRMDYQVGYEIEPQINPFIVQNKNTVFGYNIGLDMTRRLQQIGLRLMIQYQGDFTSSRPEDANKIYSYKNRALLMNIGFIFFVDNTERES